MFAERGPEVAIPLNDPRAKKAVNEAFGGAGGGTHNHFHINVNGSDLTRQSFKELKKINGQLAVDNNPDSFRLTKDHQEIDT